MYFWVMLLLLGVYLVSVLVYEIVKLSNRSKTQSIKIVPAPENFAGVAVYFTKFRTCASIGFEYSLLDASTDLNLYVDHIYRYTHGFVNSVRYFRQTVPSEHTAVKLAPRFSDTFLFVIPFTGSPLDVIYEVNKKMEKLREKMIILPPGFECSINSEKFFVVEMKMINALSFL